MRILLDESLPRKLKFELVNHEVRTVQQVGWNGLKNGESLRKAAKEFDVFITGDQNLEYQQNPVNLPVAVIVLVAVNNRIETLRPLVPELLRVLSRVGSTELVSVGS